MKRFIADTSFLFALVNKNDRYHQVCASAAITLQGSLIIPVTVLPEIAYLTSVRLGHHVMRQVMVNLAGPGWTLETATREDLARSATLLDRYADSALDWVDSTLIALAERLNIPTILTLDHRHFRLIRPLHCISFDLLPQL